MRRTAPAVLLMVLALATAACTSSKPLVDAPTTASTSPAGTPTTAAPTTTFPLPPTTPISIPRSTDGTSPDGSGCDPASGATLPDGIWFGVLTSVDAVHDTIGLDLACWFSGKSAQAATGSTSPVDDDHYIRNQNPKIYVLPTAPQVAVLSLAQSGAGGDGEFNPTTTGVVSANAILTDTSHHYVWVQVTHGFVVVVQGQFTP